MTVSEGDLVVPDEDGDSNEATASGILPGDAFTNGPATFDFAKMDGELGLVGTEEVTYLWDEGLWTLTASSTERGVILTVVITNEEPGAYTLTLNKPVLHEADGNTEGDASVLLTYTVRDADNDSTDGTLTVTIDDDSPTVSFMNSIGSTSAPNQIYEGLWTPSIGADAIEFSSMVYSLELDSILINGEGPISSELFTFKSELSGPNTLVYQGISTYDADGATGTATGAVEYTVTLTKAGDSYTYSVDFDAAPQQVTVTPNEFSSAVQASGPVPTYEISYADTAGGGIVTAVVSVNPTGGMFYTSVSESFSIAFVGSAINASSDGIGIDNNVVSSYYDKSTNAFTAESLRYNPPGDATAVTLVFKQEGNVGFGNGGSDDVLYITVHGKNVLGGDVSQDIVLDSRALHGDSWVDGASFSAISSTAYDGGNLSSYPISVSFLNLNVPLGEEWSHIEFVDVTAGFYTVNNKIQTTDVKVAFGFETTTVTELTLPVELNFTATIVDADGDTAMDSFKVSSVNGTVYSGTSDADYIVGSDQSDSIAGALGNDILVGGIGNDTLIGGVDSDTLDGGAGTDLIGFAGATAPVNFTLVQSDSDTSIDLSTFGLGTDTYKKMEGVMGSDLNDTLTGSSENDIIAGGAGNDSLDGGAGNGDLVSLAGATAGVNFTLVQATTDTLINLSTVGLGNDTYKNMEGVVGSSFNDTLAGSSLDDILVGAKGNDILSGGTGGADTFKWMVGDQGNAGTPAVDTIGGFDTAIGSDKLDIADLLLGELHAGATDAGNLASYLHFSVSSGTTTLQISTSGSFAPADNGLMGALTGAEAAKVDQTVVFSGTDLNPGSSLPTQEDIIKSLFADNKLITG